MFETLGNTILTIIDLIHNGFQGLQKALYRAIAGRARAQRLKQIKVKRSQAKALKAREKDYPGLGMATVEDRGQTLTNKTLKERTSDQHAFPVAWAVGAASGLLQGQRERELAARSQQLSQRQQEAALRAQQDIYSRRASAQSEVNYKQESYNRDKFLKLAARQGVKNPFRDKEYQVTVQDPGTGEWGTVILPPNFPHRGELVVKKPRAHATISNITYHADVDQVPVDTAEIVYESAEEIISKRLNNLMSRRPGSKK